MTRKLAVFLYAFYLLPLPHSIRKRLRSPFLCPLPEFQLICFVSESCLVEAVLLSPCGALMNAFRPSLPCFSASHYHSVELISLLTAGAIMRPLSLVMGHFKFLQYSYWVSFPTNMSLLCGFWCLSQSHLYIG